MQFASFSFIFLFLPAALAIYHLTPERRKMPVMLGISFVFLLSGGIGAALILLLLTAGTYGAGLLLERFRLKKILSSLTIFSVLVVFLLALALLRSSWILSVENQFVNGADFWPAGLAFFALQAIGYCADVKNGRIPAERRWMHLFLYMLFFPRLIMGPVVSYRTAQRTHYTSGFSISQIGAGLMRFLIGLSKKLLLANSLAMLFEEITQGTASFSVLVLWIGALEKLTAIFLELSGYADMAVGLAMCFGVRLPEGYGKSVFFPTVIRFSEQFNRTVVQWFSHYAGRKFHGRNRLTRSLTVLAAWGCIGLWYGFRPTTLLWGILIGLCLCIEYAFGFHRRIRYRAVHYFLTMAFLSIGTLLLVLPDFSSVYMYLRGMFSMNRLSLSDADWYLFRSHGLMMLAAFYVASGHWQNVMGAIRGKLWFRRIQTPLTQVVMLILLLACTAVLMTDGTAVFQLML